MSVRVPQPNSLKANTMKTMTHSASHCPQLLITSFSTTVTAHLTSAAWCRWAALLAPHWKLCGVHANITLHRDILVAVVDDEPNAVRYDLLVAARQALGLSDPEMTQERTLLTRMNGKRFGAS